MRGISVVNGLQTQAHTHTLQESILRDTQYNSELNSITTITLTGRLLNLFLNIALRNEISRQISFGQLAKLSPKYL